MDVEVYLDTLEELIGKTYPAVDPMEAWERDAVNVASDSLAFCKTMFDNFKLNGTLTEDAEFDLSKMENLIDALVGELSAAVLYLKGQPPGRKVIDGLREISSNIHQHNSLAKEEDRVPHVVEAGFSRLADRIESTVITAPGPDIV